MTIIWSSFDCHLETIGAHGKGSAWQYVDRLFDVCTVDYNQGLVASCASHFNVHFKPLRSMLFKLFLQCNEGLKGEEAIPIQSSNEDIISLFLFYDVL